LLLTVDFAKLFAKQLPKECQMLNAAQGYFVGWSPTNQFSSANKINGLAKVCGFVISRSGVRVSMLAPIFQGVRTDGPGPFFIIQMPLPVGSVGGPDLSASPNPPVILSTPPVLSPSFFGRADNCFFYLCFQYVELFRTNLNADYVRIVCYFCRMRWIRRNLKFWDAGLGWAARVK
jgi:hypothetical protein